MTTLPMPSLLHTAFYKLTPVADPQAAAAQLRALAAGLTGSVVLAPEGISGALAGSAPQVLALEQALLAHPFWAGMAFKHSACTTAPFARLKVQVKPHTVAMALVQSPVDRHNALDPQAWRALIAQPDVVLLDNRNSFEWRLGHFKGANDPEVANFRDFPARITHQAASWRAQGRRVAMYCTGGIRCEKSAGWMRDLGLQVYQLDGGILRYFEAMPDAHNDWTGECFVFDNRIALDTHLQETATTLEDVYQSEPDEAWRLARARRLQGAVPIP
ncbi:MAG: hypothetical protein RLZZ401_621 [Pseudomonadota bacterium]|jgi:UPF0176 protein